MIKRMVGWFVLLPLCALLVAFALANRHAVTVGFDPLAPQSPIIPGLSVPLYAVIYAMLVLGVVLGGVAAWFAQGQVRRERRRYRREAAQLADELKAVRQAGRRGAAPALLDGDDFLEDD